MKFAAQRELLTDCLLEVKPILEEHWKELARNQDKIKLAPKYLQYMAMEKAGVLRAYVVRTTDRGEVAGYASFVIHEHLHYEGHVWALSDLFFVRKKFRRKWWKKLLFWQEQEPGAGTVLFSAIEADLRQLGVSVIHTTFKTAVPMAGKMFKKRGYELIEYGMAKSLI